MAAKSSGGGAARLRNKNTAMAAYMKEHNIHRSVCRCPMCHGLIAIDRIYGHLGGCHAGSRTR